MFHAGTLRGRYVRQLTAEVLAGHHDDQLVYRKRLRQRLDSTSATCLPMCRRPACAEQGLSVPGQTLGGIRDHRQGPNRWRVGGARWTTSTMWTTGCNRS